MEASTILTLALTGLATFAGGIWAVAKGKLSKVIKLGREALDVATTLEMALEDDKITKDEIANIKIQLNELKGAWKSLIEKGK